MHPADVEEQLDDENRMSTVKCRKCSNLVAVTAEDKKREQAGKIFYCSYECYCNG